MQLKEWPLKKIAAVLLIVFMGITGAIAARRAVKGSNDFDTFYAGGRAVMTGQGVYYTGENYETKEGGPFLYPPFAACFFALFAWLPLPAAAFLWNAFSIGLTALSISLSLRILRTQKQDLAALRKGDIAMFTILGFAILLDNLTMAQVNILIFALTLAALDSWVRGKKFEAGSWLSIAVFIKLTPALFLLYFLLKRQWKVLAGFMLSSLVLTLVIPTVVFGIENNRLYHRQWAGRMIKPQLVQWVSSLKNEPPHPDKKTASVLEKDRRSVQLIDKNQTLSAALHRLFLKDRVRYGYEPEPIYAARRYEKMPVLIPVPETLLVRIIAVLRLLLIGALIYVTLLAKLDLRVFAAFFLGMTLLSPLARTHQFISWIFVYLALAPSGHKGILAAIRVAAVLYFMQALPYGRAAGFGAWSNLTLYLASLAMIVQSYPKKNIHD
jgi:hypothetical protein